MPTDRLRPSDNVAAASWIAPRLGPFASGVGGVVPHGFEAYARILHPAFDADHDPVTWGEVAGATGAAEHPLMQFHSLVGVDAHTTTIKTPAWSGDAPQAGDLEPDLLGALLDVLARHSTDVGRCWFALWEGYGWVSGHSQTVTATYEIADVENRPPLRLPPAPKSGLKLDVDSVAHQPRLDLPSRSYLLFEGPLFSALEMGHSPTPNWFLPQSPNIFWPADLSWCVATEIDFPYTYVGGTRELIDDLLTDVRLEVWEAQLDDPVTFDSDELNR